MKEASAKDVRVMSELDQVSCETKKPPDQPSGRSPLEFLFLFFTKNTVSPTAISGQTQFLCSNTVIPNFQCSLEVLFLPSSLLFVFLFSHVQRIL